MTISKMPLGLSEQKRQKNSYGLGTSSNNPVLGHIRSKRGYILPANAPGG